MRSKYWTIMVLVLSVGLIGYWGYNHYLRPDPEVQQQLEAQFGSEFFTSFEAEAPAGIETIKAGEGTFTATVLNKIEAKRDNVSKDEALNAEASPDIVSEEVIILKYVPQFQTLENESARRLEALWGAALREYRQQKQAGTLDLPKLARKYIQAGTMLEANVDARFYGTLVAMQAELEANCRSTKVITEIEKEYAAAKAQKRFELLGKAQR